MAYKVVPVNPRTGKVIKKPRKGQQVIFNLQGPRGGLKKLSKHSQPYLKKDQQGLSAQAENTKGGNFVAYEQLTKSKFTKADVKARQALRKEIGIYKTKITGPQPANKQRPMFYVRGKQRRALDLGFKKGNKISKFERRPQIVVSAGNSERIAKTKSFFLYGATIKEALGRLQLDTMLKQIKGKLLYYTMKLRIYEPKKGGGWHRPIDIPASGSIIPGQNKYSGNMVIDGKFHEAFRDEIPVLANMKTQIAKTIRYALKDSGYKFTSLRTLQKISNSNEHRIENWVDEEERRIEEMQGANFHRQETINNAWSDFEEKKNKAWDAHEGIMRIGNTPVKNSNLQQITEKWKVEVFLNFEIAG